MPCKGCKNRWVKEIDGKLKTCHSECEEYKVFVKQHDEELKARRRDSLERKVSFIPEIQKRTRR